MAAAMRDEYATMPYPIIFGSVAAGSVLPRNWCPQATLQDGPLNGGTHSAATGSSINNAGEKVVPMNARQGQ